MRTGQVLEERFRILAHLGSGGFGEVYQALDLYKSIPVAIKTFSSPALSANQIAFKRFAREASILDSLEHPHIITTYGEWLDSAVPFLALEFLRGTDLEHIDLTTLSTHDVFLIMKQTGEAIDHAHSCGFIHRDIKPGNIFLEWRGAPERTLHSTLIDFGIGQLNSVGESADDWEALTRTNMVVGTPQYMAPEQWKKVELTGATDIYAYTLLCYELLFGLHPFPETGLQKVYEAHLHMKVQIPEVDRFGRQLSSTQRSILSSGLSKRIFERPPACFDIYSQWSNGQQETKPTKEVVSNTKTEVIFPSRFKRKYGVAALCILIGAATLSQFRTISAPLYDDKRTASNILETSSVPPSPLTTFHRRKRLSEIRIRDRETIDASIPPAHSQSDRSPESARDSMTRQNFSPKKQDIIDVFLD